MFTMCTLWSERLAVAEDQVVVDSGHWSVLSINRCVVKPNLSHFAALKKGLCISCALEQMCSFIK